MDYWVRVGERERGKGSANAPVKGSPHLHKYSFHKKISGCGTVLRSGADPFGMNALPGCRHRIEVWGPATGELGEAPPRVQRLLAALSPLSLPLCPALRMVGCSLPSRLGVIIRLPLVP